MSEFSDCYYLLDTSREAIGSLLKSIHRYGMILPLTHRYTPFLVDGAWDAGQLLDKVIERNPGVLLHYSYAEDHGLWITAYERADLAFTIDIQRRGPSENDRDTILEKAEALDLVSGSLLHQLQAILTETTVQTKTELDRVRTQLSDVLDITFFSWLSCAGLSMQTQKKLACRFPEAVFVLPSRRGKADTTLTLTPNEWCAQPGLPAFMYLPVPTGIVDDGLLERHVNHWLDTNDWDDERQVGFWLYTAYCRALPSRMRYLANRIMNLGLAFDTTLYEIKLRQTIIGILAVTDPAFDWEPYLNQKAGEQRL
jgi:hypothetical protein